MRLGHIGLAAKDPRGLADFYAGFLGLKKVAEAITDESGQMVLMSGRSGGEPELQLMSNPQGRHMAFQVDSLAELRRLYAVAKERQTRILFSVDHGPTLSFYFTDPEGNACELFWVTGRRTAGGNRPIDLAMSEEELLGLINR